MIVLPDGVYHYHANFVRSIFRWPEQPMQMTVKSRLALGHVVDDERLMDVSVVSAMTVTCPIIAIHLAASI